MSELGVPVNADEIVGHDGDLLDGFVLDARDAHLRERIGVPVQVTDAQNATPADRIRVAPEPLAFAATLPRRPARPGARRPAAERCRRAGLRNRAFSDSAGMYS